MATRPRPAIVEPYLAGPDNGNILRFDPPALKGLPMGIAARILAIAFALVALEGCAPLWVKSGAQPSSATSAKAARRSSPRARERGSRP